ncbi:cytochrome b/b6 domain-containing protein [Streptomyces sp. NPDC052225]|uniref:cytochrome b/b6 domain-containing protein n=1 Tax=Streptomyces sp. NPDC052225 TaxID=3154949 RepID=UPI00341ACB41
MLSAAALALVPVVVVTGSDAFRAALDFTTGVLSLVSLTASVVWGLVASDRLFLTSRQRLLAQAVHRATAVASIGFLLLHVSVKLALAHVTLIGALIPFGTGVAGSSGLIGLGVLAGLLMVATGVTGALRSSMASPARLAARWRATHMLAYPAWCMALVHGLYAGRAPKTYVIVLYCLCLLAVTGAVGLRSAPLSVKRKVAARILEFLDRGPRAPRDVAEQPLPATAPPLSAADAPARPASAPAGVGFAAAYRAVSAAPRAEAATQSMPYVDVDHVVPAQTVYTEPGEPAPTQRWPAPSPPPPAEAPRSAYDPAYDTPYGGVPTYPPSYGDTANSGTYPSAYQGTYEGAYDDGSPRTEPLPDPFQAPTPGEPWTTPYGGTQ